MAREYQKSKVYDWEEANIPKGQSIKFADAQAYVNEVWAALGLKYPPIVHELPKQTRKWAGKGHRNGVWLPTTTNERVILHELAHSLTMTLHGFADADDTGHGPEFVGMYIQLVGKFMGLSTFALWFSAEKFGIEYEKFPKPRINMVE